MSAEDYDEGSPFVNREEELKLLRDEFERFAEERSRLVLIKGEAGVGKTALVEHLLKDFEDDAVTLLKGRCLYYESTEPFIPFFDALGEDKIKTDDAYTGMPGVGYHGDQDVNISLMDRRQIMFNEITETIRDLSQDRPVLFVIEDLQWIDPSSAKLLHYLTRHTGDCHILLIGVVREEEMDAGDEFPIGDVISRMKVEKLITEIEIQRFGEEETGDLICGILGVDTVPDGFSSMVYEVTEGNPYYIKETLKTMLDQGSIRPDTSTFPTQGVPNFLISSTIENTTKRRMEKLTKTQRRVLLYAAVMGAEFEFSILKHSLDMEDIELLDILDELKNQSLIKEITSREKELFRFSHIQTRTILYRGMGKSRKRVLHGIIGRAREELYKDDIDEHLFRLSRDFFIGKDHQKAFEYSIKAGEYALDRLAVESAIEHFQRALESLENLEGLDQRKEKLELLQKIGELSYELSMWDTAESSFKRLLELAEEDETEAICLRMLGHVYRDTQRFDEAEDNYRRSLELSERIGDKEGMIESHNGLGYIRWRKGTFSNSLEHYERSIVVAEDGGLEEMLALTYIDIGNTYGYIGHHDRAIEYYEKSIPALTKRNSWRELSRVYNNLGDQHLKKGNWERSVENFDRTREYADKIGNKLYKIWATFNQAEALAWSGDTISAEKRFQDANNMMVNIDDVIGDYLCHHTKGVIKRMEGDHDSALKSMEDALDVISDLELPFTKAETWYDMGNIYLDMDQTEDALEQYEKAKEVFEKMGAESYLEKVERRLSELE